MSCIFYELANPTLTALLLLFSINLNSRYVFSCCTHHLFKVKKVIIYLVYAVVIILNYILVYLQLSKKNALNMVFVALNLLNSI